MASLEQFFLLLTRFFSSVPNACDSNCPGSEPRRSGVQAAVSMWYRRLCAWDVGSKLGQGFPVGSFKGDSGEPPAGQAASVFACSSRAWRRSRQQRHSLPTLVTVTWKRLFERSKPHFAKMLKNLPHVENLSHIPRVQKPGPRPTALAFPYPRPGQKPAQAKAGTLLLQSSSLSWEPAASWILTHQVFCQLSLFIW